MSCTPLTNAERARIQFVLDYFAQNYEKPIDQLAVDALKTLHSRFGYSSETKFLDALRDSPHTAILQGLQTVVSDTDGSRIQFVINYFAQNYEKPFDQFAADALKELHLDFGFATEIKFLEGLRDAPHTTLLQAMLNVSCSGGSGGGGGGGFPVPIEYWKFDEASGNRIGQVAGTILEPQNGQPVAAVPGKIGLAAILPNKAFPYAALSLNPYYSSLLRCRGTGFTIAGWANMTDGNQVICSYGTYDSGNNNKTFFTIDASGGSFKVTVSGTDANNTFFTVSQTDTPPPIQTWFFYRVWFDVVSGRIKVQVNNGAITQSVGGLSFPANPTGSIDIYPDSFAGFGNPLLVDEMGIWMPALTDDQAAFLYNLGNGRTYPFN